MLIVKNVRVITGDGVTDIPNGHIVILRDMVHQVCPFPFEESGSLPEGVEVLDGNGNIAIPGIINHHAHCVSASPFMATGGNPVKTEKWHGDLKTHLKEGTTTLMTVDCFTLAEELAEAQKLTRIRLAYATCHTPVAIQAAHLFDGAFLQEKHEKTNVLEQINRGAAAIGEVGAGVTLGGGGQDYKYIPEALQKATGTWFDVPQCRDLKYAVLGRFIEADAYDAGKVQACLENMGLAGRMAPEEARDLVTACVMKGFSVALSGIREAAALGIDYQMPVIVHNATSSAKAVVEAAQMTQGKTTLIAAHSNHSSFLPEEALHYAAAAKRAGAVVDVGTLDAYGAQKIIPDPTNIAALLKEDLVDLISTDYGGGNFDSLLQIVNTGVQLGIPLPKLFAMCTGNVAKALPLLAPNRGFLESGRAADVTIINRDDVTDVTDVIIDGHMALKNREVLPV